MSASTPQKLYFDKVHDDLLIACRLRPAVPHPEIIAVLGAAQSCLETGYGIHSVGGNYFGIKAAPGAPSITASTIEHINGVDVRMDQAFAVFGSPQESALGYVDFLLANSRYHAVLAADNMPDAFLEMGRSGYATAPNYGAIISQIAIALADPVSPVPMAEEPAAVTPPRPSFSVTLAENTRLRAALADLIANAQAALAGPSPADTSSDDLNAAELARMDQKE